MADRRLHRWTRDLHLYLGLFVSPFVLVFAISVILLNHTWLPWGGRAEEGGRRSIPVSVAEQVNSLALAETIRLEIERQTGISGEIGSISRNPQRQRIRFPLEKPGESVQVMVELAAGVAHIEPRRTGIWDATVYLHRMPGPHLQSIRRNWWATRVWGWLADITVYLILFLTATGLYLWTVLRAERRAGLIALGSGTLTFLALILLVTA